MSRLSKPLMNLIGMPIYESKHLPTDVCLLMRDRVTAIKLVDTLQAISDVRADVDPVLRAAMDYIKTWDDVWDKDDALAARENLRTAIAACKRCKELTEDEE